MRIFFQKHASRNIVKATENFHATKLNSTGIRLSDSLDRFDMLAINTFFFTSIACNVRRVEPV